MRAATRWPGETKLASPTRLCCNLSPDDRAGLSRQARSSSRCIRSRRDYRGLGPGTRTPEGDCDRGRGNQTAAARAQAEPETAPPAKPEGAERTEGRSAAGERANGRSRRLV